ncbi:hypothetical protein AB1K70_20255 [Bremerella sp. JC770]|uniref:hypothetical protein n=1 Tax=Bremerella sp. JC770 TaxID=3232137 RepID=UPI00345756A1
MTTQDTNTNAEKLERKYFGGDLEHCKQILVDGAVAVASYGPNCCMDDEAGNPKEETRGHVWRLVAEPDYEGYLDRGESLQLFVDILDIDQPVEKAAAKRIREAAAELSALADKIDPIATQPQSRPASTETWAVVAHQAGKQPRTLISGVSQKVAENYAKAFNRSDDFEQRAGIRSIRAEAVQLCVDLPEQQQPHIVPPVTGFTLLDDYEAKKGPEVVPNVRIQHHPESYRTDDDGNEIEGTRGHLHSLEFNDKATDERGGIFTLSDSIDDRDAATVNEAAANRLLAASDQLRDSAFQLAPHTAEQLSRLMVEITGANQPRYVVGFKDPRVGFCEVHNQRSTDGTTARIIERPTLADVPDTDFNQVREKAGSNTFATSTSADNDGDAGENDNSTAQGEPRQ